MKKPFELRNDGQQTERFVSALRKVVSVSKKDVETQMAKEREERAKTRDRKRKV